MRGHDEGMRTHRTRLAAGTVAALLALSLAACGSSGGSDGATTTTAKAITTTTAATTTTTTKATTTTAATTTTTPPATQPAEAVWPFAGAGKPFTDPAAVARSFVVDYLGFKDPVVGAFQQGDARSGEVPVKPAEQGPVTTVLVRQLGADGSWWVIGASTPSLQLASPAALAVIGAPVTLSGTSTAFEATINLEIRQDGSTTPLAEDFAMGGSNGEMGPFTKEVSFESPNEGGGAIILKTLSAEDGRIWEASVIRVAFA